MAIRDLLAVQRRYYENMEASEMSGLVAYPFKLRPDVWVYLRLPSDFSRADADRIGEWLALLADVPASTRASAARNLEIGDFQMETQNEKPAHPIVEPPEVERPDRPPVVNPGPGRPDRPGVEPPITEPEPPDRPKPKR